jgi:hypothetical protein
MKRGVLLLVVMAAALLLASGAALAATATHTDEVRGVEISAGRGDADAFLQDDASVCGVSTC